jgi:hypothetical protein
MRSVLFQRTAATMDPQRKQQLLEGAKGCFEAWWAAIRKHDPEAIPGPNNRAFWMKDWNCSCARVNGFNANDRQFFMEVMLLADTDDNNQPSGNRLYISDAELPTDWQRSGIYSAGLAWLVQHKQQLDLNMKMTVHVSLNDAAWERIAQKFGFEWTNH